MKQITLLELICVLIALIFFVGLGYAIYQITDLKYQSLVVNKLAENEKWRNELTIFLNYNVKIGRLVVPIPQEPDAGRKPDPQKSDKKRD